LPLPDHYASCFVFRAGGSRSPSPCGSSPPEPLVPVAILEGRLTNYVTRQLFIFSFPLSREPLACHRPPLLREFRINRPDFFSVAFAALCPPWNKMTGKCMSCSRFDFPSSLRWFFDRPTFPPLFLSEQQSQLQNSLTFFLPLLARNQHALKRSILATSIRSPPDLICTITPTFWSSARS